MTHAKKHGKKSKKGKTNMDIELFCDKLDRGEITDFGPFLQIEREG